MSQEEKRIVQLISWTAQSLLSWLGVGLGSSIGIIELLPVIREIKLFTFILFEILIIFTWYSVIRIFDFLTTIIICNNRLIELGWQIPKPRGMVSNKANRLIVAFTNNMAVVEIVFFICIFILANLVVYENSNLSDILRNTVFN